MNNQEHLRGATVSLAAGYWFYIALVLALLLYAFLFCFSIYGLLYESEREFSMHLAVALAGANGLVAAALTLRRKLYGAYWSLVPCVLICLFAIGTEDDLFTPADLVPMALLFGAPAILLLSQIPTLRKLKTLGPGWGLGAMAYANPDQTIPRAFVWWFRIALTLAFLVYLGMLIGFFGILISDPPRAMYSLYMMGIAAACGLFAVLRTRGKEISGIFWSLAPCLFLGLGAIDVGLGRPLKDFTGVMLPIAIVTAFLLFSQIPYMKKLDSLRPKKLKALQGEGFQKTHFTNGSSFSDEDLNTLYTTWSAYAGKLSLFYISCTAGALLAGPLLAKGIGGFIGNISAVALLIGANITILIVFQTRRKRYRAFLEKFGLTEKDIRQALRHRKRGTAAVDTPPAPAKEET